MNDLIIFNAVIEREVYNSENFKVYAVAPTTQKDKLKYNKYGNVSICGNIQELSLGMTYTITGKLNKKDGYDVMTIKTPKPKTLEESRRFLYEVITERQANLLLEQYPNIIDMIINDEPVDLSNVKGIKDKTFAKIKGKVEDNFILMEFIEEFSDYDLTLNMARKLRSKYKSISRMRKAFTEDPYTALCSISGIGFKKADTLILSNANNKHLVKSKMRAKACVDYLLNEDLNNGNTWIDINTLHKQFYELAYESEDYLLEVLSDDEVYYYNKESNRVSFMYIFLKEVVIANTIKNMLEKPITWNIDFNKYINVNGFDLSKEQQQALPMVLNNNIGALIGSAGVGKSCVVEAVVNMLKDNDKRFLLLTPTGKASTVYENIEASTVHRGLGYNPQFEENPWTYNCDNKLKDIDVVFVDEVGMLGVDLLNVILNAIDITKTKLFFIGDASQLPSVNYGNVLHDIINSKTIPVTELTTVFRVKNGKESGILSVSENIRHGVKFVKETFEMQQIGSDFMFISSSDDYMMTYIKNLYKQCLQRYKPEDIVVLVPSKKGNICIVTINEMIQKTFNPHKDGVYSVKSGERTYREGDVIMQVRNNYRIEDEDGSENMVFNGESGFIKKINYNNVIAKYKSKTLVYSKDSLSELELGYSMTIHKSQGSGYRCVIVALPRANTFILNKNILYTAITRAKESCFLIGLPSTINSCINRSAELNRNTWLLDLLKTIKQNIKK